MSYRALPVPNFPPLGLCYHTNTRHLNDYTPLLKAVPVMLPPPQTVKQTPKHRVSNDIKQDKENVPPPPKYEVKQEVKRRLKHVRMDGVVHWLDGLESGDEVLEKDEVLITTAVSYDADGRKRFRRHRLRHLPRAQTSPACLWDLASGARGTQC